MSNTIPAAAKRVIILVLDSLGVGELPDAALYDSVGSNTLGHIDGRCQLRLPCLESLGLGNIIPLRGVASVAAPRAAWGKMAERGPGMDSVSGHWEISGIINQRPLPLYPHGFPPEVVNALEAAIGREFLYNGVADGERIIAALGDLHCATGKPVLYTSADSVMQIAAHTDIIPLDELYAICQQARQLMRSEHGVGRIIARPFSGGAGNFRRLPERRDFSLMPPSGGILPELAARGIAVAAVGKVYDIFAGLGFSAYFPAHNNDESLAAVELALAEIPCGLIFANLIDFDMLYGHRDDTEGYARALTEFDAKLVLLLPKLAREDILFISADHGNDPTLTGHGHSREYVPLLVYGAGVRPCYLGVRASFADIGETAAEYLYEGRLGGGESFLGLMREEV